MRLHSLFVKQAPNAVFASLVLGTLSGIGYAVLIPLVLSSVSSIDTASDSAAEDVRRFMWFEVSNYRSALLFVVISLFILVARTISQVLLANVALDATTRLRVVAYARVLKAPIKVLERIGPERLMAAMTTDVQQIVIGASAIPGMIISSIAVLGMLGYLYLLNSDVFSFVIAAMGVGIVSFQIPMTIGRRYFKRGRAKIDELNEGIRGLLYGTKELKLSRAKCERYLEDTLLASENAALRNGKLGRATIIAATNYGDLLGFFVIGVIAYVFLNYYPIDREELTAVAIVLIYIIGPLSGILYSLPNVAMAQVALRNSGAVFDQLVDEETASIGERPQHWTSIRLSKACFHYDDNEHPFKVGPIDCEFRKGEITFIVGGNGSGKSSVAKLVSLHYIPTSGEIFFGDLRVDRSSLAGCRECIAAIFADYYLFDRILEARANDEPLVERYLAELGLQHKVKVRKGRFTTLALSLGQRKRLALMVALLDDRDVYIFDEWAAEQDGAFKTIFYDRILPELKERNKVVVVISHDARYFHVADKIFVMDEGRILANAPVSPL